MDTIADQLADYRERLHVEAQHKYSEIILRFDAPRPGDVEALNKVMIELKTDQHQLEHDIHLIQRYRSYLDASKNAPTEEEKRQAKKDADGIHSGSNWLFLAEPPMAVKSS